MFFSIEKIYNLRFLAFICFLSYFKSASQTYIPDDNFEQALINLGYDTAPLDNYVPTQNITNVTNLDLVALNIQDLTGIEDFISLVSLDCSENLLTNLDVSQNTALTELYFYDNQIQTIDVSSLTSLQILWCYNNVLTQLNVAQNLNLISLVCNNNALTNLNLTNNALLNVLVCSDNNISNLDVSNNLNLNRLECANNNLNTVNLSANTNLSYLDISENSIANINLSLNRNLRVLQCSNNQLNSLDVSNNNLLTSIDCSSNNLCNLNLRNGNNSNFTTVNFSLNRNLNCVIVDNTNGDFSSWQPSNFSNYVSNSRACSSFVPVDDLNDFIGRSYTLPILNNGSYFTASNGEGIHLFAGDVIEESQIIYIYNENTCDFNESSFSVFITDADYYIPKYFTPNNDGSHDLWTVIDNTNAVNNITIYNRYGKLLKHLLPYSEGWDGTFKGQQLPSDDYWYVLVLNSGAVLKGHFTLKR